MVAQKHILRAMIGYQAGIVVAMFGAAVVIFFYSMSGWLKFFSILGLISGGLGTIYSLSQTWKQYKTHMEFEKDLKDEKEVNKNGKIR